MQRKRKKQKETEKRSGRRKIKTHKTRRKERHHFKIIKKDARHTGDYNERKEIKKENRNNKGKGKRDVGGNTEIRGNEIRKEIMEIPK